MNEILIILRRNKSGAAQRAHKHVTSAGGHVRQQYGPKVLIVEASPEVIEALEADKDVAGVYRGPVPEELTQRLDETGQLGVAAWNQRHSAAFQEAKKDRPGEGLAWDHPDYDSEGRQEP